MNTKKKIAAPVMLVVCLIGVGIMAACCIGTVCWGLDALEGAVWQIKRWESKLNQIPMFVLVLQEKRAHVYGQGML